MPGGTAHAAKADVQADALRKAVLSEAWSEAVGLAEGGAPLDTETPGGETLATRAAFAGRADVLRVVDRLGAPKTADCSAMTSPLLEAVKMQRLELVEELLGAGWEAAAETKSGETPLTAAVLGEIMRADEDPDRPSQLEKLLGTLLRAGADLGQETRTGTVALCFAVAAGATPDMIRVLLDARAPVNQVTSTGKTALVVASEGGRVDVAKILVQGGADVNLAACGTTPLMRACRQGFCEVARLLVHAGADPHVEGLRGTTALIEAVRGGADDVVGELLEARLQVDQETQTCRTALVEACTRDDLRCIHRLLRGGADVNRACADGSTPLLVATRRRSLRVIKKLCEEGAEPEVGEEGESPLDVARRMEQAQVHGAGQLVQMLEQYTERGGGRAGGDQEAQGPDPHIVALQRFLDEAIAASDFDGMGRIMREERDAFEAGRLYNYETSRGQTMLSHAAAVGETAFCRQLVALGALVERENDAGMATPLICACAQAQREVAVYLLEVGADPNRETRQGRSALLEACYWGSEDIVRLLVEHGADPNHEARGSGWTPLTQAAARGHQQVVRQLLYAGATVDLETATGATALIWAARRGHLDTVQLLLTTGKARPNRVAEHTGTMAVSEAVANGHVAVVHALVVATCVHVCEPCISEGMRMMLASRGFATWAQAARVRKRRREGRRAPAPAPLVPAPPPGVSPFRGPIVGSALAAVGFLSAARRDPSRRLRFEKKGKRGPVNTLMRVAGRARAGAVFPPPLALPELRALCAKLLQFKLTWDAGTEEPPHDFVDLVRHYVATRYLQPSVIRRQLQALVQGVQRYAEVDDFIRCFGIVTGVVRDQAYTHRAAALYVRALCALLGTESVEGLLSSGDPLRVKTVSATDVVHDILGVGKEQHAHPSLRLLRAAREEGRAFVDLHRLLLNWLDRAGR